MRLLTWNINSVRLRLPLLERVMQECAPDVVCLQETKTPDENFPRKAIEEAGYTHIHINGMKSYNGVAILSRLPFDDTAIHHRVGKQDCRHVSVKIGGVDIHNLYIPAGGDIPDVTANDKFAHKLDFVDEVGAWFADRYSNDQPVITLGDFNIAPLEHDVWSHKQLLDVVSHTPIEVEKIGKMQRALDWHDAIRHFVPENEKCYTWWSYRNHDWRVSNRGRRLDHIWATKPLVPALKAHKILIEARDWEKPSDHVPVMIDVAV
jgi:exodeoxyribonuclease-3